MTCTFATYEHHRLGFPGYVLKWTVVDGSAMAAYTTLRGIIEAPYKWHHQNPLAFIEDELKRFDDYTAKRFSEDASVQG